MVRLNLYTSVPLDDSRAVTPRRRECRVGRPATTLLLALSLLSAALPNARADAPSASYRVTFEGTWTPAATPGGLPGGAHFSSLIGAVHNDGVAFWRPGEMASPGIESMAEIGGTSRLRQEIEASGHADAVLRKSPGSGPTPVADLDFEVTRDFPLVTLVTMIAPSPDWFVGVSGLSLLDDRGQWHSRLEVDLFPYDAGTEDGERFSLSNPDTVPQGVITSIRGMGRFTDEPMARLTFVLQEVSGSFVHVPLFPPTFEDMDPQGFVRVINRSSASGSVEIVAVDDAGARSEPLELSIAGGETRHFNSTDLVMGEADKGLSGHADPGEGDWRLEMLSALDVEVLSFIRAQDGFLTSMHDVVPRDGDTYRVAIFNPASNRQQESRLRLINPGAENAEVTLSGVDDRGVLAEVELTLEIAAGAAAWLSAEQLETGLGDRQAGLGDGTGKWQLQVRSNQPLLVMSLLKSETGHLTNLSTAPHRRIRNR